MRKQIEPTTLLITRDNYHEYVNADTLPSVNILRDLNCTFPNLRVINGNFNTGIHHGTCQCSFPELTRIRGDAKFRRGNLVDWKAGDYPKLRYIWGKVEIYGDMVFPMLETIYGGLTTNEKPAFPKLEIITGWYENTYDFENKPFIDLRNYYPQLKYVNGCPGKILAIDQFILLLTDNGTIRAGCRIFKTIEDALAHWDSPKRIDKRAQHFTRVLEGYVAE